MKNQNRKVLLVLDNATYHPCIKLSNMSLIFFPANTTSITQPMHPKCFAKADFKEIEETDVDEDNQPLNELVDMLRKGCQDIDAEAVVSFDDDLSPEEVIDRAVQLIHDNPGEAADQEDDGENNDEEDESKQIVDNLKAKSYAEALCAVRDLEEFAASKNCPMLVELMQDATGLIEKVTVQKTVKQRTLMDMWQNTASI
ncbi:hypothetical protein PR048_029835 [Dryococelus australis]|uniref:DDE-1 domain-containing protein n=1 Tax=Dryococelus australis TaxID=614101 RepID=A0ABQ9GB64_9NEOP|nr:hypothetical protein PR048_029835 [Dryococelus australis]